jgi:hypothetical protein
LPQENTKGTKGQSCSRRACGLTQIRSSKSEIRSSNTKNQLALVVLAAFSILLCFGFRVSDLDSSQSAIGDQVVVQELGSFFGVKAQKEPRALIGFEHCSSDFGFVWGFELRILFG